MPRFSARWLCLLLLVPLGCKRQAPRRQGAPPRDQANLPALAAPRASASSGSPVTTVRSALARREACEFKKGDLPEKTLAPDEPIGQRIPIDHFVIVMQENR